MRHIHAQGEIAKFGTVLYYFKICMLENNRIIIKIKLVRFDYEANTTKYMLIFCYYFITYQTNFLLLEFILQTFKKKILDLSLDFHFFFLHLC